MTVPSGSTVGCAERVGETQRLSNMNPCLGARTARRGLSEPTKRRDPFPDPG